MILGLLDIIASMFMFLAFFSYVVKSMLLIGAVYLLIKSIIFSIASINIASIFDFVAAMILFASFIFHVPSFLFLIAGALVFQKGIFSLF
jgi:hypothetical protein